MLSSIMEEETQEKKKTELREEEMEDPWMSDQ